jgi:hypothetical protein
VYYAIPDDCGGMGPYLGLEYLIRNTYYPQKHKYRPPGHLFFEKTDEKLIAGRKSRLLSFVASKK